MRNDSSNSKLDRTAAQLLRRVELSDAEVESIVESKDIFKTVLGNIRREQAVVEQRPRVHWLQFLLHNRVAFGSIAAVGLFGILATTIFLKSTSPDPATVVSAVVSPDADVSHTFRTAAVDEVKVGRIDSTETEIGEPEPRNKPLPQKAVYRRPHAERPQAQPASYSDMPNPNFVALSYLNEEGESVRGGRVVRVDIPRSTLFAMGFNLPPEGSSETLKADLLIGPDGVTRAIRFVEQY